MKQKRPRKYQSKLTLHPLTFEQAVDKVLAYKPSEKKTPKRKTAKKPVLK